MASERLTPKVALARIRRGDKDAAWAWLDQVGSYPSSDPEIRETTDAANRLLRLHGNPSPRARAAAFVVGGLALAAGAFAIGHFWPRKTHVPVGVPVPTPYPPAPSSTPMPPHPEGSGTATEPAEGWEARWQAQRNKALGTCRRDQDVTSWPQAVTCLLEIAYPEATPWNDPNSWLPWQQDAAQLVTDDLRNAVTETFGSTDPTGWELQLWLRGARVIADCHRQGITDPNQLAGCVAKTLYPAYAYPPIMGAPQWVRDFWVATRAFAQRWHAPTPMGVHFQPGHPPGHV